MQILDRKLVRDIGAFRGHAAGIVVVLACAAAAATMSFSVQRSLEATRSEYYRRYDFADLFASAPKAPLSLAETIRALPDVDAAEPRLVSYGVISIDGADEPITAELVTLPDSGQSTVDRLALVRGRSMGPDRADDVIVNEGLARAYGLAPGATLRVTINGKSKILRIAATALSPEFIYALAPGQIVPDDSHFGIIWINYAPLAADLGMADEFNDLVVKLRPDAPPAATAEQIARLLAPYGGADVHGRDRQYSHAFVSGQLRQLAAVGLVVPLIFAATAVFLSHVFMLRFVELQRPQIGIIKALGFSDATVAWHYGKFGLALAGIAAFVGLVVGAALGYGMTAIYTQFFHFPFLFYRPDLLTAICVVVMLGCAAISGTWQPIRRVVALPPATATRPGLPITYGTMPGGEQMARRLGAPALMILRQLVRRPVRAMLTSAALASAVGLQIATLFSFDALDEIVNVFYARAQRQDATIVFAAPLPAAVLAGIGQRSELQLAEGFRNVAVRVGLAGRERQVALVGLPASSTLNRLLDLHLVPISPPRDGIALSEILAAALQAKVGDRVTLTVSGSGNPVDLSVRAIVEQYIGMGAYMELGALDGLLGHEALLTGVNLKLRPGTDKEFYRGLKESPMVAGFTRRTATVESFRKTMARTLTVIVSFFVIFAIGAAFAVVDATFRIALSERRGELMVLRAIGFSEGEVAFMLGGELGVCLVVALPLGCGLGIALGGLLVWNLNSELFHVPLVVGWDSYAIAISTVVGAAGISIVLTARRLSHLNISEALRAGASW